jgi:microcystin-dependent protein
MATPFVGQIISVGFPFAPLGWLPCDGRTLPVSEYNTLYTLLGTTYGGDGITTFNLPNLNGRVVVGVGQGTGLSNYVPGQVSGNESITLTTQNTPAHNHSINVSVNVGTAVNPKPTGGGPLSIGIADTTATGLKGFYVNKPGAVALRPGTIQSSVPAQPHENRQQFLVLNYIIAWAGVFPSRG